MELNFISKECSKDLKFKQYEIVTPVGNFLYAKSSTSIEVLDLEKDKNELITKKAIDISGKDITTMQVNADGSKIFIAKPEDKTISFKCFSKEETNIDLIKINPPTSSLPEEKADNIILTKKFNFLVFSVSTNIYVYKGPEFTQKSSPCQTIKQTDKITNILVTEKLLYYTTTQGIFSVDIGVKNASPVKMSDEEINKGFAFLSSNDVLHVVKDNKIIYFPNNTREEYTLHRTNGKIIKAGSVSDYVWVAYDQSDSLSFIVLNIKYNIQVFNKDYGLILKHVAFIWGALLVITEEKSEIKGFLFTEQTSLQKLDSLTEKKKFELALIMAGDYNVSEAETAQVYRKFGDFLYEKSDFDGAIEKYINTIGFTEPSYVITKFVDPCHAENLAKYLQKIPQELKSKQHTTLLFNCYTKAKNEQELKRVVDGFVADAKNEPTFDIETAVDVLKRNGYQDLAQDLAKAYRMYSLYMGLLYESQKYAEMLEYIEKIPGESIGRMLLSYGPEIITKYPEGRQKFIDYVAKACTEGVQNIANEEKTKINPGKMDPIFVNNPEEHFKFLLFVKEHMTLKEENWNTLIELGLRVKSDKIQELLNDPNAAYTSEKVLVYMNAYGYEEGLTQIYEKMKLYPFLLHKASPEDIVNICNKYGHEMPELWSDGLITIADSDCSEEVLSKFLLALKEADAVPFLTVLAVLRTHSKHSFAAAHDYVVKVFSEEQKLLRKALEDKKNYDEQTVSDNNAVEKIEKEVYIVNQKKCSDCGEDINGHGSHFLCGHSYHDYCISHTYCVKCREIHEETFKAKIEKMEKAIKDDDIPTDGYQSMLEDIENSIFNLSISVDGMDEDKAELEKAKKLIENLRS